MAVAKHPPRNCHAHSPSPRPAQFAIRPFAGVPGSTAGGPVQRCSRPHARSPSPPLPRRAPTQTPAATLTLLAAVPQHRALPSTRRSIFPRYALLADTTLSYIPISRTTMPKSRLRHRSTNATGPPEISVHCGPCVPEILLLAAAGLIYACKRPSAQNLAPLPPSLKPSSATPCPRCC